SERSEESTSVYACGRPTGFFAALLMNTVVRGAHASSRAPLGVSPSDVPGETPSTACGTQALHGKNELVDPQECSCSEPPNRSRLVSSLRMTFGGEFIRAT